ncbi:MAG: DUF3575 domain-containing protein [Bacteroidia bacterium]|nr:DUF3575 domain-containing protein [Bacteroidia bacterium]
MLTRIRTAFLILTILTITKSAQAQKSMIVGGNVIKFNITAAALSHYSLQYERVTGLNQSFAIGFGISPDESLPFKSAAMDAAGDNEDAKSAIESMKFTKFTITPEYRFYISKKGAPKGFYVATFARYTNMTTKNTYEYTPSSGKLHFMEVEGSFKGYGAGAMIGLQWLLGSNITLDWWIVGPFIGVMDSQFTGTDADTSDPLTDQDRADLEQDIESIELPLWELDAEITGNNAVVDVKGPFYGARFLGLCLGFRF